MPDLIRGHVGAKPIPTRPKASPPLPDLPDYAPSDAAADDAPGQVFTPAQLVALPQGALLLDVEHGRTYRRTRIGINDPAKGWLNAQDWSTEGMLHGGWRPDLRIDFLWANLTERPMVLLWVGGR